MAHLTEEIIENEQHQYKSIPCIACDNKQTRHFIEIKVTGQFMLAGTGSTKGEASMTFRSMIRADHSVLKNVAMSRAYEYFQHVSNLICEITHAEYSDNPTTFSE